MGGDLIASSTRSSRPKRGHPRVDSCEVLIGILFVLYTAISGMTCWRRLGAWQDAELWDEIHRHMLERLGPRLAVRLLSRLLFIPLRGSAIARNAGFLAGEIDWSRASIDSSSVATKKGAMRWVRTRIDRGMPGPKRHMMVDRGGMPRLDSVGCSWSVGPRAGGPAEPCAPLASS